MTIITEDGTGLPTAETLASVAECDAYHLKRGNTAWATYSTPQKEWALRRANDHLRQKYRLRWKGHKLLAEQGCEWPRASVVVEGFYVESTSVPATVKNAAAELALRSITSSTGLNPDQSRRVKREKVGPLETEYVEHSSPEVRLTAVDDLLSPYLSRTGSGVPLVRR